MGIYEFTVNEVTSDSEMKKIVDIYCIQYQYLLQNI